MCLEQPPLCSVVPSCVAEPAHEPACLPDWEGRAAQVPGPAARAEFLVLRCSEILRLALKGLVPVLLLLSYSLVTSRRCKASPVLLLWERRGEQCWMSVMRECFWPRWQEQSPSGVGNARIKPQCMTQAPHLWQSLHKRGPGWLSLRWISLSQAGTCHGAGGKCGVTLEVFPVCNVHPIGTRRLLTC